MTWCWRYEDARFSHSSCRIVLSNKGSVGLHKALGLSHIGTHPEVGFKHGAWQDVGYCRTALDVTHPPKSPEPFSGINTQI